MDTPELNDCHSEDGSDTRGGDADPAPDQRIPREWTSWALRATQSRSWDIAAQRWTRCITEFGPKTAWRARLSEALLAADRPLAAQAEFASLANDAPADPAGLVGQARVSTYLKNWPEAERLWRQCLERFPEQRKPEWTRNLGRALCGLNRYEEAECLLRELLQTAPNESLRAEWVRTKIWLARTRDTFPDERHELVSYVLRHFSEECADAAKDGLRLLIQLGCRDEARKRLRLYVEAADSVVLIERALRIIPQLVEHGPAEESYQILLGKLEKSAAKVSGERNQIVELRLRILLALKRFEEFVRVFASEDFRENTGDQPHLLAHIRDRFSKARREVLAERKIFGIGIAKTGTTSLSEALIAAGFDAGHFTNPATHQLMAEADTFMLEACVDGYPVYAFETLYEMYPNALFIWTTRERESWCDSFLRHHRRANGLANLDEMRRAFGTGMMNYRSGNASIQQTLYLKHPTLVDAWDAHEARVRSFFADKPTHKLLEFNVFEGEGWPKLCSFLNVDVPATPFPWSNRGTPTP